jgi:hypothetical protein
MPSNRDFLSRNGKKTHKKIEKERREVWKDLKKVPESDSKIIHEVQEHGFKLFVNAFDPEICSDLLRDSMIMAINDDMPFLEIFRDGNNRGNTFRYQSDNWPNKSKWIGKVENFLEINNLSNFRLVGGNVLWSTEKCRQQACHFDFDPRSVKVEDVLGGFIPLIIIIGLQKQTRLVYVKGSQRKGIGTKQIQALLKSGGQKVIEFGTGDLVLVHGLLSHAGSAYYTDNFRVHFHALHSNSSVQSVSNGTFTIVRPKRKVTESDEYKKADEACQKQEVVLPNGNVVQWN